MDDATSTTLLRCGTAVLLLALVGCCAVIGLRDAQNAAAAARLRLERHSTPEAPAQSGESVNFDPSGMPQTPDFTPSLSHVVR